MHGLNFVLHNLIIMRLIHILIPILPITTALTAFITIVTTPAAFKCCYPMVTSELKLGSCLTAAFGNSQPITQHMHVFSPIIIAHFHAAWLTKIGLEGIFQTPLKR